MLWWQQRSPAARFQALRLDNGGSESQCTDRRAGTCLAGFQEVNRYVDYRVGLIHTYIQTDRQTDRHRYINTYIHPSITYIHAYVHTDIRTYIR